MRKHFVELADGRWVNARQVCYVRVAFSDRDEIPDLTVVGFHGSQEIDDDASRRHSIGKNELIVGDGENAAAIVAKLEAAMQEGAEA